ncbi:hypothetical protein GCM10027418_21690 [Mariniluteicoccus endophyticus]
MVEPLKKARTPIAWLVLVGVGIALLSKVVTLAMSLSAPTEYGATPTEFSMGFAALVLVVVAANVLGERSPHANVLAWVGAGELGLSLLLDLVFSVMLMVRVMPHIGGAAAVLQILSFLVGPLVLGGCVWALVAMARAGAPAPAAQPALEAPHPQDPNATTWQPDHAAGAAWSTASGAASGAQASGWGVPGKPGGGWQPNQGQPQQALGQGTHDQGHQPAYGQPAYGQPSGQSQPSAEPAAESQPSAQSQYPQQGGPGPQIIYPGEATDTTQFRGKWDPTPRE